MNVDLTGKNVLVTGGSKGFGYASAMACAEQGATVSICARDSKHVEEAARVITERTGSTVFPFSADVSVDADLERLIGAVKEHMGCVDVLMFSTGHPPAVSIEESSEGDWQRGYNLIVKPAVRLTQAFLGGMREKGFGRFIYVSSIYAIEPEWTTVVQCTFRAGLNSFSKCIATEFAAEGITANTICPGYFDTPLVQHLAEELAAKENIEKEGILKSWEKISPSGKFGRPEDLGAFVAFLASSHGAFINGRAMVLDGGSLKSF